MISRFIYQTNFNIGLMLLESLRLRQLKITRKFHPFCLNMSCRLLLASGGVSPCQQRLSFSCWILAYLRKTLLESSEIFVEHTPQGARIWFLTQACACDSGLGHVHRIINKWMLALENYSLTRENKIDQSKSLGCGDLTKRFDVIQAEQSPSCILPRIRKQITQNRDKWSFSVLDM